MLALKEPLKDLVYKALKFVGRSEVNEAVVYLGLLGVEELETWLQEDAGVPAAESSSGKLPNLQSRVVRSPLCVMVLRDVSTAAWPGGSWRQCSGSRMC